MTEQQIPQLAGALVTHQRHFGALLTKDAQWVIQNTAAAIALCVEAIKNRANSVANKLLEFVTTTNVVAIESFKAEDTFKVDTKKAATRIYYLGDNFQKHFGRKEEGASEATEIKVHKLLEESLDAPIITELGGNAEITLGQFFSLLSKQEKGEPGPLLTNGWMNIAYIRDDEGILWAVRARWRAGSGGWSVGAYSVEGPRRWSDGSRVLSR